ncbi:M48 family metallopeptidase [Pontibacterium granulatum]|uniref:M48 family metallopeptidase n=1 Tax=Pontibacterium granulatum TaxID=2036029 RepID=UPI00249BE851|nr:M48 family metallopeptidase [Pontibacterium granulatum]MDI3324613.1 M48 family metallopeptidase [Pontibacterium granulatum]
MQLEAYFYDGQTSRRTQCVLEIDTAGRFVLPKGLSWSWQQVEVSARIGDTARFLDLPDGSRLESGQNDLIDQLCTLYHPQPRSQGMLHILESRLRYVAVAVVITILAIWWFIADGVPALSNQVAQRLPAEITQELGAETLTFFEKARIFGPSQLSDEQQATIRTRFQTLVAEQPSGFKYKLHFRDAGHTIGANALALPSGDILITDQLIELAEHPDAILGVLAHEVGHVEHRHSLRMILQSSTYPLIVTAVTGDTSLATTVLAALPTMMIEAHYSRDFEEEADLFAKAYMTRHGIDSTHLGRLLAAMESAANGNGQAGWLSSHPATDERVKLLEQAQE